ncbi:MAG: MaoC family dehydratase [Pseudomonadota bacterium]|nr:MaoC family dehydratase [Pseudomonadota bacterium]
MSFFEDYAVGESVELGRHLFTAEDIVRFASAFDPQPFHVSEEGAARSHFGRLAASGWHTAAVWMRLNVEHRKRRLAEAAERGVRMGRFGPSPGFDEMKWLKPVYVGDVIAFRSTVRDKRDWPSRPGWGLIIQYAEGFNQAGERVFSFIGHVLVERRAPAAAPEAAAVSDASRA